MTRDMTRVQRFDHDRTYPAVEVGHHARPERPSHRAAQLAVARGIVPHDVLVHALADQRKERTPVGAEGGGLALDGDDVVEAGDRPEATRHRAARGGLPIQAGPGAQRIEGVVRHAGQEGFRVGQIGDGDVAND
jgi:hypothetical protein